LRWNFTAVVLQDDKAGKMVDRVQEHIVGLAMTNKDFGKDVRQSRRAASRSGRVGAVNVALLFAVAAMAVSLVLTPVLSDHSSTAQLASQPDLDTMSTGSIPATRDAGKRYTIRRSILQETPGSVCIVGAASGDGGC
jgi:hypothetical protein